MRKAVKWKRKPEPEVIIRSTTGAVFRLRKSRIVELDSDGVVGRYATKANVRKSLRGAEYTEVRYPDYDFDNGSFQNSQPVGQSLGCMVFLGANLAKLRKWAGVKSKEGK